MRRTTSTLTLLTFLALLASFCFQAKSLPFFGNDSLRNTVPNAILHPHATSSGVIDLKKDAYSNGTFYVEADLSSSYHSQSTSSNNSESLGVTDTVRMMVSIVNSETLVASDCISFSNYDCSRYKCTTYGSANPIDFPTFTANVNYGRSFIYLDYNYWGLNYDYLYIAKSCSTQASLDLGNNRYGVLGLGTANGAHSDFTFSAMFSVLIDSDMNGGKLRFTKDSRYTQSSPLNTLFANETWQISAERGGYIETPSAAVAFKGNVMFDINSEVIGLPYDVYTLFFNYFSKTPNVSCFAGLYRPSCSTTQTLEDLPDLTLSINGDQIKIPSKIYATLTAYSETYKYFWFNFKATDPSYTGKNYISPSFAKSVILDANFMSYYYTVFDATSGSNVIYLYSSTEEPSPEPSPAKWIGFGAVGAIVLVGICICACKKKATTIHNRTTVTAPLNNTTFNVTSQAPLVYDSQGIQNSAPNYSYEATNYNYNYNGYNYPAQPQGLYNPGYIPPLSEGNFQERAKQ